jgi:hypothetical protein
MTQLICITRPLCRSAIPWSKGFIVFILFIIVTLRDNIDCPLLKANVIKGMHLSE